MKTDQTDRILTNLMSIERGLAKVYTYFSTIDTFTGPVKKFWAMPAQEEEKHTGLFENIANRRKAEDDLEFTLTRDMDQLRHFVEQVNHLV
jgi:hypothetical protein